MSKKYYYTKIIDFEVLIEAIKLRTSLRSVFTGCSISLDANGQATEDNIELTFSRALLSSELDEITSIINAIDETYDLTVRKNIERDTMRWAIIQGQTLIEQFGANNLYRQKTEEQILALNTQYMSLTHSFLTGSLNLAHSILSDMQPDANISQEEIDEFKLRLEIVLGL